MCNNQCLIVNFRYEDALADFEYALQYYPNDQSYYEYIRRCQAALENKH